MASLLLRNPLAAPCKLLVRVVAYTVPEPLVVAKAHVVYNLIPIVDVTRMPPKRAGDACTACPHRVNVRDRPCFASRTGAVIQLFSPPLPVLPARLFARGADKRLEAPL